MRILLPVLSDIAIRQPQGLLRKGWARSDGVSRPAQLILYTLYCMSSIPLPEWFEGAVWTVFAEPMLSPFGYPLGSLDTLPMAFWIDTLPGRQPNVNFTDLQGKSQK